jgi:hypothetical protein
VGTGWRPLHKSSLSAAASLYQFKETNRIRNSIKINEYKVR